MQIDLDLNLDDLRSQIVDAAASQVLGGYVSHGPDGEEGYVQGSLERDLREQVRKAISEHVRESVGEHVRAILAKPIPPMDMYGQPRHDAAPTTVVDLIREELKRELTMRGRSYDSNTLNGKQSTIYTVVHEEVRKVVQADMQEAMDEARTQVKTAVKDKAAELLAAETVRAAGIR